MAITKAGITFQRKLCGQAKKSDDISYSISKFSPKHRDLQKHVNAMLLNGHNANFIIQSTWKDENFGNYSMDNIKTAITAGRKLTKTQIENYE